MHSIPSTNRPSWDEYFVNLLEGIAARGSCVRRKCGCILVEGHHRILSTGYNGRGPGVVECLSEPCEGATLPSGTGLASCEAIHAEQNALMQCRDIFSIHTVYVSASPCVHCIDMIAGTSAKRIVFLEEYPGFEESKRRWLKKPKREWICFGSTTGD